MNTMIYLKSNTKTNYIRKVYKEDRNSVIFFPPNMDYFTSRNLFDSFSKRIAEFYFAEDKLLNLGGFDINKSDKNKEVYNQTIRQIIEYRSFLNRFFVIVNPDFTVRNENVPDIS